MINDVTVQSALPRYFDVIQGNGLPAYIQCKYVPVSYDTKEETGTLWRKHDDALQTFHISEVKPELSLLDLKRELASRIFRNCCFCERRCGIDRTQENGSCKVKQAAVASEFLHLGEERVLIPSYTIFFSGCTFHCVFCQNWDISQHSKGVHVPPETLAGMIETRKKQGALNVNWVGGDPTPNLPYILDTLKQCETYLPQIWNSNMYCSIETMKLLNGVIDLYLTDFKYGNDHCALRLSDIKNYMMVVKRNHQIAYQQGEMIIRHLVMPNHISCCSKPILRWIAKSIPHALVNIMGQYHPEYQAFMYEDISRHPSTNEIQEVVKTAEELQISILQ